MRRSAAAFWLLSVVTGALTAAPLHAREWTSAGGWDIVESGDFCGMGLEYEGEGETLLVLGLSIDGSVTMSVSNYNWSAVRDQDYDLVYYLNGTAYAGGDSTGAAVGARKGFVTNMERDFLKNFAASTYLTIRSKDGVLVDDLKLDGSAAGLAQLRRCVAHLKVVAAVAAREKARFAHIPPDPFANVKGELPAPLTPARPRASIASLIGPDDYPADALAKSEQGTVRFKVSVASSGRVSNCVITGSSGSASLDARTCDIMRTRSLFIPARDAAGRAIDADVESSVTWRL